MRLLSMNILSRSLCGLLVLSALAPVGISAQTTDTLRLTVIGGFITSTVLTLFVVPAVYTLHDDLAVWFSRRRHAAGASTGAATGAATGASAALPSHRVEHTA